MDNMDTEINVYQKIFYLIKNYSVNEICFDLFRMFPGLLLSIPAITIFLLYNK